jgi:prolyl 4-hydroxylase
MAPTKRKGEKVKTSEHVKEQVAQDPPKTKNENKEPRPVVEPRPRRFPWGSLAVAFLSLVLGILTPPLMSAPRVVQDEMRAVPVSTPTTNHRAVKEQGQGAVAQDTSMSAEELSGLCSEDKLKEFWHENRVPGYHIACVEAPENSLELKFYKGGTQEVTTANMPLPVSWPELQEQFETELSLPKADSMRQPWAVFSAEGERLVEEDAIEGTKGMYAAILASHYGIVLVFEGGQFLWPGTHIGFQRTVSLYSIMPPGSVAMKEKHRTVTLETLSLIPLVLSVSDFLSDDECDFIQTTAAPTMKYSEVTLMDKDVGRPASDFRTSQTGFLQGGNDGMLRDIDFRTASLVRVPVDHQEHVQVLRYGLDEKYDSHHDYFDPQLYKNDPATLDLIKNGRRNRFATVFWYLSDVEKGGETVFPRFNRRREMSMKDCSGGLKVKPEKGKVIIFYSMTPNGKVDPYSLHGACPVESGLKWAGNKWIWNEPQVFISL